MNITVESILNKLCSFITKISTKVGSFAYFILMACSYKYLDIEGKIYALEMNEDIDTADYEGINKLAKQRGLFRKAATSGIAKGQFNVEIPSGSRFQIGEIIFVSGDYISQSGGFYYYKLISEQTGTEVNKGIGKLTPITYVEGLTYAYAVEMIVLAEDIEDNESFIKRYNNSFGASKFAGNKQYYRDLIGEINGVGGVKVYACWSGPKTVKCTIISSDFGEPSNELVEEVQEYIDPDKIGEGDGHAPIGAHITIEGVSNQNILIGVNCQFQSGTFEDWKTEIINIINSYFLSINKKWADSQQIVVRKADIISKLMESENIVDVNNLLINGEDSNLVLYDDYIAFLDDVVEIA